MTLLAYYSDGGKVFLSVRQRDAAINAKIHLDAGAEVRILDGAVGLEDVATVTDPRIPPTVEAFDLLYPDQPAIVN